MFLKSFYLVTAAALLAGVAHFWLGATSDPPPRTAAVIASEPTTKPAEAQPRGDATNARGAGASAIAGDAPASDSTDTSRAEASFESAPDLYALAVRAASSNDRSTLLTAFSAMGVCIDVDIHQQRVGHLLNATPADPKEREVARAATVLLSRCRGFGNNDFAAIKSLRREVGSRLREAGGYAPGISNREMTPAEFREVVDSRDWLTFEYGLRLVAQSRAGKAQPTVDDALFGIAYTAAGCDFGKNCGSESVTYAAHCLRSGECLGSWEKTFDKGLNALQRATVARYRAEIVRAVAEKDYAYFGVAP